MKYLLLIAIALLMMCSVAYGYRIDEIRCDYCDKIIHFGGGQWRYTLTYYNNFNIEKELHFGTWKCLELYAKSEGEIK